jgi:hypothetical protein
MSTEITANFPKIRTAGHWPAVIVALVILLAFTPTRAELPPPVANMELIPAGSLIIPMDNDKQNVGVNFNLNAYGLANTLLWADVQVKWAIRTGKVHDGIDFNVDATRVYPTDIPAANLNFSGGPFIIHRDAVPYALATIIAFGNSVAVYETTQDVNVDVRFTLTQAKKIGVLDDGGNADIHTDVLDAAGFVGGTHYNIIPAATLLTVNANACYTLVSEPHWDVVGNDVQANAVRQFTFSGGNFLAQCAAIESYENNVNFGLFHSTDGLIRNNDKAAHSYPNADLAFGQFQGPLSDEGGTISDFELAAVPGNAYRNGSHGVAENLADTALDIAASAKLSIGVGSNVMYLGGHKYQGNALQKLNGRRLYLNAAMVPSGRPASCGFDVPNLPEMNLIKTAFWSDGTPIPSGAVIPSGVEFKYMLYVNNQNFSRTDISVRDILDPAFQYQAGTVQVDNSVVECAAAACTPAEEQTIFNTVSAGGILTDAVDADVASYTAGSLSIDAGDGTYANQRLDVNGDAVWAILFSVRMQ